MADMLKFRKGSYDKIMAQTPVKGTIYIAEDEKAMYVDIADGDNGRIRIGDFIRVDTVKDITPPYSTSSLYYVEADNALLKYDGSAWKQVNGTDDLADRVQVVENDVATLKGTVGNAEGGLVKDVADNAAAISELESTVDTQGNDIEALKSAIGMDSEGNVEGLAGSVVQLRNDLTAVENSVEALEGAVAGNTDSISKNKTAVEKAQADATQALTDAAAAQAQADKGVSDAAAAKAQADKGVSDAAAAKAVADANAEDISSLISRVTALDSVGTGRVAVLEGKVNTLENAGYATVAQVNTAKAEVLGTDGDAAGTATVHGALKSAAAADAKAVAAGEAASAAQAAANNAQTDATDALNRVKAIEEAPYATTANVATAKSEAIQAAADDATGKYATISTVNSLNETVAGHTSSIRTLNSDVAKAQSAAEAAQKTADDYIADHADDYTNAQIDTAVADAKKAGTDAAATANANASAISQLQADLKAVADDYVTEGELTEATDKLEGLITKEINAANAMDYQNGIGSQTELDAIVLPKSGDTYVVTAAFGNYYPGDLLIATGEEDEVTGTIVEGLSWTHVKTGYDATLEQTLSGANNKIKLSSVAGANNGEIAFAATGSASVAVANNTVTVGMVWDEF